MGGYCRNPGNGFDNEERERAWCFVGRQNETTWEYCSVPDCEECGDSRLFFEDYQGTESTTKSGKTCALWLDKEDQLKSGNFSVDYFQLEANYCRNPGAVRDGLWCYTDNNSSAWEFCNDPPCSEVEETNEGHASCGSESHKQADYRGRHSVTRDGIPCQRWDSQEPHMHKITPESHPSGGLEEAYCRNPDNSDAAWCYTTDPNILWAYCDVPMC